MRESLLVRPALAGLAIAGVGFLFAQNVGIQRMASLASVEAVDVVPAQRPTYRVENLYYEPALVDAILERWSAIPDLPLEDATEEEENQVDELRRLVLKAKGLEEPPKDWHNHHYVRGHKPYGARGCTIRVHFYIWGIYTYVFTRDGIAFI